jgi:hypothetical protein
VILVFLFHSSKGPTRGFDAETFADDGFIGGLIQAPFIDPGHYGKPFPCKLKIAMTGP